MMKGYKRRTIFDGWNNFTEFEKEWIEKVKVELHDKHGIVLGFRKPYGCGEGASETNGIFKPGQNKIVPGRDALFSDSVLLRYIVTRRFEMAAITRDVIYHLEWRQINVPAPKLTNKTLNLLNKGILYIHGRSKDLFPIIILDFKRLSEMLQKNEINEGIFCSLYNFISLYIINNMTLPGQVEKWITICNINKF